MRRKQDFYKPKFDKEIGLGMLLPSLDDIAQAIAKRDHSRIVPTLLIGKKKYLVK